MELENQILDAVRLCMDKAITSELVGYNKPLSRLVESVVENHISELKCMMEESVSNLLSSDDFKVALRTAVNDKLAKTLINKIGGEIEARVNELKRDPVTRAKLTVAIDEVVKDLMSV